MSVEKASLLRRVKMCVKGGESMRSEVSSRRCLRDEALCDEDSVEERTPDS